MIIDKYALLNYFSLQACYQLQAMSNRCSSSRGGGGDAFQQTKCSACNRDLAGSSKNAKNEKVRIN